MAGPFLTFTNVSAWLFAFVFGTYTRNGFEVAGIALTILYAVFFPSDFSTTTIAITPEIELWYHCELPIVILLGALAGQEFTRMFQLPRLITLSNPMPHDLRDMAETSRKDPVLDWLSQLYVLAAMTVVLGINFWAGRTMFGSGGLSPIGDDLTTPGAIATVLAFVLMILMTVTLLFVDDIAAKLNAKYLWLSILIPLTPLIQTYAQYTWGWNNGWPEFLWYGLLIVAFLVVTLLSIYIPVRISEKAANANLVDVLYDGGKFSDSRAFAWIYYGSMLGVVIVTTLIFNLAAMWESQPPNFGSYILMGISGGLIVVFIIVGVVLWSRFEKLLGRQSRYSTVEMNGVLKQISLQGYE